MRRLVATLGVLAVAVVAVMGTGAGDDDSGGKTYKVELDNAFGMIEGADVKVAGVRAGKIKELDLDESDMRAIVGIEITETGFDDLRKDAFCETRPQSLIGEYFLDCRPGKSPEKLAQDATIPVEQTAVTVPPDLVQNIMRRPYRERLTIIYHELGAALAARGPDLNETIRRASPALRETDRVLAILREQRRTIRDLYDDADKVLVELADNRDDVLRFVREARDTARVSAERTRFVKRNFQLLPNFLHELGKTSKLLGDAAANQEGALRNLNDNRVQLKAFLKSLGDFATASRPSFRTLGEAAAQGRRAAKAALPRIEELRVAAKPLPEAAQNLAITLEHLDDPKYAVEKDPRSPRGGQGYTGLEAFLRYLFTQSLAINLYDANNYILKVALFLDNNCAPYRDAAAVKGNAAIQYCRAILGPNQPGIDQPDPTATAERRTKARRERKAEQPAQTPATSAPSQPAEPTKPALVPPEIKQLLEEILPDARLDDILPGLGRLSGGDGGGSEDRNAESLLDFLLGS